jgi:hypothetical protein
VSVGTRTTRRSVRVSAARVVGTTSTRFVRYLDGTLAKHWRDTFEAMVAGKTPASSALLYSLQDHATPQFTRSPAFFAAGSAGLPSISPSNTWSVPKWRCGSMVTPRDFLLTTHFGGQTPPANLRLVTAGGVTLDIPIIAAAPVPGRDITVGTLASTPTGIGFLPVPPSNWYEYLPTFAAGVQIAVGTHADVTWGLPLLATDQEEKGIIVDAPFGDLNVSTQRSRSAALAPFYEVGVGGDSGNPMMSRTQGQLELWTVNGGPLGGTFLGNAGVQADVNAVIAATPSPYTSLTQANWTAWPTFPAL